MSYEILMHYTKNKHNIGLFFYTDNHDTSLFFTINTPLLYWISCFKTYVFTDIDYLWVRNIIMHIKNTMVWPFKHLMQYQCFYCLQFYKIKNV